MEKYSMGELAQRVGKTGTHIRTNIFKKEPFKSLLIEHKYKEKNTGNVFYDEVILKALLDYYDIEEPQQEQKKIETVANGEGIEETDKQTPENTETNPPPSNIEAAQEGNIKRLIDLLEKSLEDEKKRVADLENKLDNKERERLYLFSQLEEARKKNEELNEQLRLTAPVEQPRQDEHAPAKMSFMARLRQMFKK